MAVATDHRRAKVAHVGRPAVGRITLRRMVAPHPRSRRAFTLVELLVVIGIIAVLVGILLPALAKARRQAVAVKCLANLHQLGLSANLYASDYKGAVLPSYVWSSNAETASQGEGWAFLLVVLRYLPDPRIQGGRLGPSVQNSVLVCPSVRDSPAADQTINYPTGFVAPATTGVSGYNDGYFRGVSSITMPNTITPTPEPTTNGALGACILDVGYCVNGCTDGVTWKDPADATQSIARYLPMQATAWGTNDVTAHIPANLPHWHTGSFPAAAQTPMMFDGSKFNAFNAYGTPHLWRLTGSRHGNWSGGGADPNNAGVNQYRDYSTGIVNTLFLDGHAAGVPRSAYPSVPDGTNGLSTQWLGPMSSLVNAKNPGVTNALRFNQLQQH